MTTITARYAGKCGCGSAVAAGSKIEWAGRIAGCVACGMGKAVSGSRTALVERSARRASNYDPTKFNGYGVPRGGFRRACKTDGNCSSFGSGRSCGGHDCDGY